MSQDFFSKRDVLFQTGVNAMKIYILCSTGDETATKTVSFNCNVNITMKASFQSLSLKQDRHWFKTPSVILVCLGLRFSLLKQDSTEDECILCTPLITLPHPQSVSFAGIVMSVKVAKMCGSFIGVAV